MKIELSHIEKAVRKQFVWEHDPKTRWSTNKAHNLGSKGLGASVFIGLAIQLGFTLGEIEQYMDLEPLDIKAKLTAFNTRMRDMLRRKVLGEELEKKDMTQLMSVKKDMVISYIRLHYLKEYLPTVKFNH